MTHPPAGHNGGVVRGSSIAFSETQRIARVWWITAIVVFGAVAAWVVFVVQVLMHHRLGQHPASNVSVVLLWIMLGVVAPQVLLICGLTTVVRRDDVLVSYPPFASRTIPIREIVRAEAVTYRPFGDYWGWGVRGRRKDLCYTVRGNQGVRLFLTDERRLLLGSQRPKELAAAIAERRPSGEATGGP